MKPHRDSSVHRRVLLLWPCLFAALFAAPANAAWLEASSDHFVIYGDQNEKTLRGFAERLEIFHVTMADVLGRAYVKPSPSNRVTIYVVSNRAEVREIAGDGHRYLAGLYRARAGSTIAVVPRLKGASSQAELSPETILFHEYAHHFMAGSTARAYPRWFVEGFAEFFASARIQENRVLLGTAANHRGYELTYGRRVPIREMLAFDGGAGNPKSGNDAFYGQSWALFHYLFFDPQRTGQLDRYQRLMAAGASALEAAEDAFGDVDELERDMGFYWKRRRLSALVVDRKTLTVGSVNVRALSRGAAEIMPVVIRSKMGVTRDEALELLPEARRLAALHPNDAAVLTALAEAEFDAGNDDAAIDAADRALAIDPGKINAHIQRGYALSNKIKTGTLPRESWRDVRGQFLKANQVENDHPIPLVQFYLSYLMQGEPPTKNAIEGLEWAMLLAPFDPQVRWLVAQQMVSDNRLNDAVRTLAPLAYSPHRGEHTDRALKLLNDVEARISAAEAPEGR